MLKFTLSSGTCSMVSGMSSTRACFKALNPPGLAGIAQFDMI